MPMKCRHKHNDPKATCPAGDKCEYSHCTEEVVYHPLVFKTKLCDHSGDRFSVCKGQGVHCAKAHGEADRREYIAPPSTPSPPVTPNQASSASSPRYGWDNTSSSSTGSSSSSLARTSSPSISNGEESDETYALRCTFVPTEEQRQFFMYTYKTRPCVNSDCPYCYHFHGPLERRRAPNMYNYTTTPCPRLYSKSMFGEEKWADPARCQAGDSCQYAHTVLEVMYHPALYKTQMCSQFQEDPSTWLCKWKVACSFAHGRADLSHKSALLKQQSQQSSSSSSSSNSGGEGLASLHIRPDLHRAGSTSSSGSGMSDGDDSAADVTAEFVIVCLGLPWKTSNETVAAFLGDVNIVEIFRPVDHQGRTTGEAYVVIKDEKDVERGLKHHRQHIGSRYIEVYKTTPRKLSQAQRRAAALANIQHLSEIDDHELLGGNGPDGEIGSTGGNGIIGEGGAINEAFLADASWCEVCQLQMTSIKQLREHLNGSRHQEALLKVQRLEREEVRQDSRQDRRRRMGQSTSTSSTTSSSSGGLMHGIHMGYMRKTDDDKRPEFIRPPSYEEKIFFERVQGRYPSAAVSPPNIPSTRSMTSSGSKPKVVREPGSPTYGSDPYGAPSNDGFDLYASPSPSSYGRERHDGGHHRDVYASSSSSSSRSTYDTRDDFHGLPPHEGTMLSHHRSYDREPRSAGHDRANGDRVGQLPRARSLESVVPPHLSNLSRDAPAFSPLGSAPASLQALSFDPKSPLPTTSNNNSNGSNNMTTPVSTSSSSSTSSAGFALFGVGGSVFAPTPSETGGSRLHKYTLPAALGARSTSDDVLLGALSLVDSLLDDKPITITAPASLSVPSAASTTVASSPATPSPASSVPSSSTASPVSSTPASPTPVVSAPPPVAAAPADRIHEFLLPLLVCVTPPPCAPRIFLLP
jgi:hypothetical protein